MACKGSFQTWNCHNPKLQLKNEWKFTVAQYIYSHSTLNLDLRARHTKSVWWLLTGFRVRNYYRTSHMGICVVIAATPGTLCATACSPKQWAEAVWLYTQARHPCSDSHCWRFVRWRQNSFTSSWLFKVGSRAHLCLVRKASQLAFALDATDCITSTW